MTLNHALPPEARLSDWNLLRSFLTVCEVGTLTAAAEALGLTQPTLGRHIRELEALAGETLFDRLPGRMAPTQRAELLLSRLQPLSDAIGSFEHALLGTAEAIAGTVRIATSQLFGALTLPGLMAPLLLDEPELQIEVRASDTADNLLRREADIAVRFFRPEQDDVIAVSVGQTEIGLFAHPAFVQRLPAGVTPDALRGRLVGNIELHRTLEVAARAGLVLQRHDFAYRTDSTVGQLTAIEAGLGAGALMVVTAARRPLLQRLFPQVICLPVGVWLCAHEDLRRSPRMRRVFDYLAGALRQLLDQPAAGAPPGPA